MTPENEIGRSIEEYTVHHKIGVGGFASVYQATCNKTGWSVAIKQISKEQILERGLNERVRQEVSIHRGLEHPSILKLYTFFEDVQHVYLVLELCPGSELQRRLKGVPLPEHQCVRYLHQVVDGMLYLHAQGIMHRDLTLSNLLLASDGSVRIADFGLATQLRRPDDRHHTMCGTPNYMSPEVATRSSHGLEADVWSLGVMLYTMVVGRPPFHTQAVRATITRALMEQCTIPEHVSAECRDLITQCLQKNFRERIPLQAVPHHPFLAGTRSTDGRIANSDAGDSGLYTMTTATNLTRPTALEPITEISSRASSARDGWPSSFAGSDTPRGGVDKQGLRNGQPGGAVTGGLSHEGGGGGVGYDTCRSGYSGVPRDLNADGGSQRSGGGSHRSGGGGNSGYSSGGEFDSQRNGGGRGCYPDELHSSRTAGYASSRNGEEGGGSARQAGVTQGVYRPHDPGGRHPHSPPVKIKSQTRGGGHSTANAAMNSLKRKFTGLPPMCANLMAASYNNNIAPFGPVVPPLALSERDVDDDNIRYGQPTPRDGYNNDLQHKNEAERVRSRSHEREPRKHHERYLARSVDRMDGYSKKSGEYDLETPRMVSPSRRKDGHIDGSADTAPQFMECDGASTSRHSARELAAPVPRGALHSCCNSYTHQRHCHRFGGEQQDFPADHVQYHSCCLGNRHHSGCERNTDGKPLQFVQDYVNKNSFGHPSNNDALFADKRSTDNLLGDIAHVAFTPRLGNNLRPSSCPPPPPNNELHAAKPPVPPASGAVAHAESEAAPPRASASRNGRGVTGGSLSQQCSPLSTVRLRPTRQTTKNCVLHILPSGEVCIEFLEKKKGRELVVDACRISQDGMRVVLYSIHDGEGRDVGQQPQPMPDGGAEAFHSYETLPKAHWKKYIYASRFVEVVKAKTPKITYYSAQAKCILMENSPDADFEAAFYTNGAKVVLSGRDITVTESSGVRHTAVRTGTPHLPSHALQLYSHAKTIQDHCLYLERVLADVASKTGHDSFPLTIGRKPVTNAPPAHQDSAPHTSNGRVGCSTGLGKENVSPASVQSEGPLRIHSTLNRVVGAFEGSVSSCSPVLPRAPLTALNTAHPHATPQPQGNFVRGIGWLHQEGPGRVRVQFLDGSSVCVDSRPHADAALLHTAQDGRSTAYTDTTALPPALKDRLAAMKDLLATFLLPPG